MIDTQHVKSQLEMSRNANDLNGIDKLRQAAQSGDKGALQEAAQQFEAIFVQMMLKSMRQAQDAMEDKSSPFNSQNVKFYRDMHDKQLAVDIATNGSLGMAELIVQQFTPGENGFMPSSVLRNDGNLSGARANAVGVSEHRNSVSAVNEASRATKAAAFDSPEEFIRQLLPQAQDVAEQLGIDPQALVAQAAVETGWGQYMIHDHKGNNSHNLFGIKADSRWQGNKTAIDTVEFTQGVAKKEKANFRAYDSFADSLKDYISFVKDNPRYQGAVNQASEPRQYFSELQRAGYATDPDYAEKIMSVFNGVVNKFVGGVR